MTSTPLKIFYMIPTKLMILKKRTKENLRGKLVINDKKKKKVFYLGKQYRKKCTRLGNNKTTSQQTENLLKTISLLIN